MFGQVLFMDIKGEKKSITENGQIDCPTLNNNNHKNPSEPASSMKKFESLNRLFQEVLDDGKDGIKKGVSPLF